VGGKKPQDDLGVERLLASLRRPRLPAETAMGTEPKPKSGRKRRRRKPPEEVADYIVEIESWD